MPKDRNSFDYESMTIDELWTLLQDVDRVLAKKIEEQKTLLNQRLKKLKAARAGRSAKNS